MRTAPNLLDSLRGTVAGRSRNRVEQQHSGEEGQIYYVGSRQKTRPHNKFVFPQLSAGGLHHVPVNAGSQQLC